MRKSPACPTAAWSWPRLVAVGLFSRQGEVKEKTKPQGRRPGRRLQGKAVLSGQSSPVQSGSIWALRPRRLLDRQAAIALQLVGVLFEVLLLDPLAAGRIGNGQVESGALRLG